MSSRDYKRRLYYLILFFISLPFVLPLLWMLSIAFRPAADIYVSPPEFMPDMLTIENFINAWHLVDVPRLFINTILITGLSILGSLISSSMVGYAFATLPARGKKFIFGILLMTIMVPATITLIPLFIFFSSANLTNSFVPLILPLFFANAFYVFLFRQFYLSIPKSIIEHSEIDGCNPLQTYWYIALPMSKPALAAVAVFVFINSWNDFLGPLVYLNTPEKYTISLGLSLFQGMYFTQLHYLMPLSLVAIIPVILFFFLAQRYLITGIMSTRIIN